MNVYVQIAKEIAQKARSKSDAERIKRIMARKLGLSKIPSNSEVPTYINLSITTTTSTQPHTAR